MVLAKQLWDPARDLPVKLTIPPTLSEVLKFKWLNFGYFLKMWILRCHRCEYKIFFISMHCTVDKQRHKEGWDFKKLGPAQFSTKCCVIWTVNRWYLYLWRTLRYCLWNKIGSKSVWMQRYFSLSNSIWTLLWLPTHRAIVIKYMKNGFTFKD